MTVMRFDSHRGWYNPSAPLRTFSGGSGYRAPRRAEDPATVARRVPVESRDFFILLDDARRGCPASRAELALRGQTTAPRVPLAWKP
jgi:hypothetical protein